MTEPRRRWTTAEDALLWELYQIEEKEPTGKSQKINWNEIAREIPGRSNKDCRKRYYNRFTGGVRKGSWTQEEDERLLQLVEQYQYRWATIAQMMETRNADQCSKRWHHCLNPELERSPWTDDENTLLLSAVGTHGSSWKDIQRCHFPTRSANNIKNQFTILSRKCRNPIPLQHCCDSPTPPSRRPPSSTPSTSSSYNHTYNTPSHDTYSYNSLSSTPQFSATDYLPTTPETSASMPGFDFHPAMPLNHDPCGYLPTYQSPVYSTLSANPDLMMCQPAGMEYVNGAQFQGGMVDQTGSYEHFHSGHGSFGF
ncbi:Homeodomain-like protein [Aspergillus cavernicola]|uniref:Homeodomain-like protein n=1 Tax=Aspergillus cavernicola TaxID=176166 RepID=A0ABR4IXQ8_9EURO